MNREAGAESSVKSQIDELAALLKEARTIIRCHARSTSKDWDRRATAALAKAAKR